MKLQLHQNTKLLFIGDSITDCQRRTEPEEIGIGYVRMIRDLLLAAAPADAPQVINRGISGNKVTDLRERWQQDVLDVQPDVLSIKIGINDVWHSFKDERLGVGAEEFRSVYHQLLEQTRERLPQCRIILCEPSVIEPPAHGDGNRLLQPYVQIVQELAKTFSPLPAVPLHGAFVEARRLRPEVSWTPDGVHPSSSGHMLIARKWLETAGLW